MASTTGSGWTQIGWNKWNSWRYLATFMMDAGVLYQNQWAALTEGNTYEYKILYDNYGPGDFSFYAGGALRLVHDPDWTPKGVQNFGWTQTLASQMAGGGNFREHFTNVHWFVSGYWFTFGSGAGFINSNTLEFGPFSTPYFINDTDMDIWDRDCS